MEKEKAHHSQPDTDEPTELQQPPTPSHDSRHVVEVAAVRDREVCLTMLFFFECRNLVISAAIVCCSATGAH
jgi:hypothetical protein